MPFMAHGIGFVSRGVYVMGFSLVSGLGAIVFYGTHAICGTGYGVYFPWCVRNGVFLSKWFGCHCFGARYGVCVPGKFSEHFSILKVFKKVSVVEHFY